MANKTWFITGTSRGFGREWAAAALARGDRVAGTARDLSTLDDLKQKYGDALLAITLDVTGIPGVQVGDVATLIGPDGDERITAEEVGEWSGTISYEVLTSIGPRVERRYSE